MKWRELKFKIICYYRLKTDKCEWCGFRLRRYGDSYYGGIDIKDSIGGKPTRTAYVCNLCYQFYNRKEQ